MPDADDITVVPIDLGEFKPMLAARFWSKVDVRNEQACWNWEGYVGAGGYGRYGINGKNHPAHRIAYSLIKRPVMSDEIVRHHCDNRLCCNPDHLAVGTHQDNMNDAVERRRMPSGPANAKSRFTPDEVRYIRSNPDNKSGADLARQFRCAESTIHYLRTGRSWKYLE